jgi:signal transduction histidine kinase
MGVTRSIRLRFAARVAAPVTLLVLLWGLGAAAVLTGHAGALSAGAPSVAPAGAGATAGTAPGSTTTVHHAIAVAGVLAGAGLLVVIISLILMISFARRLSHEIKSLATTALLGAGEPETHTTKEVAEAADAIADMRREAVDAAAIQDRLRDGLRQVLISLGRRNQALLHRQLRIIDELEKQAASPQALGDMFTLDHLTTRMRRHAESLTIIAGSSPARSVNEAVPVIDVIRAAAAEVEDYKRVSIITDAEEAVTATAVTDMIHLLAELIENATLFSPSSTRVEVKAEVVANGFAIEVEDRGLGIEAGQLEALNRQLENPPDFDLADADRLGLFVVARLAVRHDVQVLLCPSPYRGTKAVVMLPEGIVAERAEPGRAVSELNLRQPEGLSLASATTSVSANAAAAPAAANGTEPNETPANGPAPAPPEGGRTLHGLPRRVRPDGLPQRDAGDAADAADATAPPPDPPAPSRRPPARPEAPAPEHARNLAASLQNSWQRARHEPESEDD